MRTPRLLSEAEFRATMGGSVARITGREDDVQPEGVIDIEPYVAAIPEVDFQGHALLSGVPPTDVYRSSGGFDHVLYPCDRTNVFLVIVIQLNPDHVNGHYLLDLNREYGLEAPSNEEL